MSAVSEERVRDALREIVDPCAAATGSGLNVVEMGLLKDLAIDGGHVAVELRLTTPMCHMVPYFGEEVRERVGALEGVESVGFETDDGVEWSEAMMSEAAQAKRRRVLEAQRARYERERTEESTA